MADKQLNIAINIVTKSWQSGMALMQKGLRLLSSTLNSVFRVSTIAGFFGQIKAGVSSFEGVKKELQDILNTYSDIQSQVKTASAIMTNGGKEATAVYGELLTSLRRISTQSRYTMSDLSKALVTTTRAGLDIPTGEAVVKSATKVAFLDDASLDKTTDSVIALRGVFKLTNDEIKNYLAAALTVSNKVKMSTTTLFESIRNSGPAAVSVFKDQKQALIDLIAFTGVLQDSNLKASQSGTYARSALARLNAPTATLVSALAKYGVELFEADSKSNKFYNTLKSLSQETSPLIERLSELSKTRINLESAGLTGVAEDYRIALKDLKEKKALGEIDTKEYTAGLKKIRDLKKAFQSDKQGSTYASVMEEIDSIEEKIKSSETAFSSILNEFRTSGGKIRPMRESLEALLKLPSEVLSRATGVREGQGLALVTQQIQKFLDLVKTGDDALKDGSLLERMTDVKMGTAKNQFELLKNQVAGILSIGPEVFLNSLTPLVKTLTDFLTPIGQSIGTESGSLLDSLITNYLKPFKDSVDSIVSSLKEPLQTLKDLLSPKSSSTSYKTLSVDKSTGGISITGIEAATDKASAIFLQLREIILAGANSLTVALAPFLKDLGSLVADSFKVSGKYFVTIIMPVMKEIGQGMWEGFIAHKDEAIKTISDILKEVFTSGAFKDLSTTLQSLFNSIITNIDWSPIGQGILKGITSVLKNIPKAGAFMWSDFFNTGNIISSASSAVGTIWGNTKPTPGISTNEKKLPSIVEELAMAEKEFLDMVKSGSISLRDKNITSNEKITDAIVEQNKSAEDIKKDLKESFKTETSYRRELANYVKTLTAQTKALNDEIKKAKKDLEKSSETSKKI